jgi:ribonuclease Z
MKLTLHGTGAGTPSGDRMSSALTACFSDGSIVLFDSGDGCTRSMLRDGIDIGRITTVAISHLHADHWSGLPGLLMGWGVASRSEPVDIHVPPGTVDFFRTVQRSSYSFTEKLTFDIHYHRLVPFSLPDGWRVEPFRTSHLAKSRELARKHRLPEFAYGYLLLNGERKIVLSQDLGSEDDLSEVMKNAGIVICESAHVEPRRVLEMARDAGVGRLIFTHIPPKNVDFPRRFDGIEWSVAEEGMVVEVRDGG